jgi:hypothetical protein
VAVSFAAAIVWLSETAEQCGVSSRVMKRSKTTSQLAELEEKATQRVGPLFFSKDDVMLLSIESSDLLIEQLDPGLTELSSLSLHGENSVRLHHKRTLDEDDTSGWSICSLVESESCLYDTEDTENSGIPPCMPSTPHNRGGRKIFNISKKRIMFCTRWASENKVPLNSVLLASVGDPIAGGAKVPELIVEAVDKARDQVTLTSPLS